MCRRQNPTSACAACTNDYSVSNTNSKVCNRGGSPHTDQGRAPLRDPYNVRLDSRMWLSCGYVTWDAGDFVSAPNQGALMTAVRAVEAH